MDELGRWVPYCGEAPGPEIWLSRWNVDPVLGVVLLLLVLALWRVSVGHDVTRRRLLSLNRSVFELTPRSWTNFKGFHGKVQNRVQA